MTFMPGLKLLISRRSKGWLWTDYHDQEAVQRQFSRICPRKASGPDNIPGFLLRVCSDEMAETWSLWTYRLFPPYEETVIIPVPKKPCCKENNDCWPVALTSVVMKCLEKIIVNLLKAEVSQSLDPIQFAYRCNRGTDDAVTAVVHFISKHLENPAAYAHLFF